MQLPKYEDEDYYSGYDIGHVKTQSGSQFAFDLFENFAIAEFFGLCYHIRNGIVFNLEFIFPARNIYKQCYSL